MKKSILASVLAASFALVSPADASLNAYLTLNKVKSGPVVGSVTQKGREGKIMVIAMDHSVAVPVGGKKQHGVFTITKEVDKATPALYRVLTTNEAIPEVELQIYDTGIPGKVSAAGLEVNTYTIKLTNARITDIKFHQQNDKVPELMRYAESEDVSFSYEKITWTWNDRGITATDTAN